MPTTYEEVTEPMALDSTAQEIKGVLEEIKEVIQPTNVCVDLDVSLDVNGWSNSAPYVYNWMNNKVTTECAVKVNFLEDSEDTDELYIAYEKIVGGIQFESPTKPTAAIPVRVHIINAEADSITSISDEMVSSDAVPDAANVHEALGALDSKLSKQVSTVFSDLLYREIDDIVEVTGTFIGNGTTTVNLGITACSGPAVIRNDTNGTIDVYYVHGGIADTWDGVGGRVFESNNAYSISAVLKKVR